MAEKINILVADDSPTSRNIISAMLNEMGYNPITAVNGHEALGVIRSEKISLVISDILMPILDGFGLCIEIKKDPATKHVPVIFLTGTYKQERDREFGMYIGANAYLTKPATKKVLSETIARELSREYQEQKHAFQSDMVQSDLKEYSSSVYREYNAMLIKKLERLLFKHEQTEHKLNTMLSIAALDEGIIDDKEYLESCIKIIGDFCNVYRYCIYILAQNSFDLILATQSNVPEFYLESMSEVEVGYSFAGKVAAKGELLTFQVSDIESKTQRTMFQKENIKLIVGFPVASGQGVLGVGLLFFEDDTQVGARQYELLTSFGRQIGIRLAKQKLVTLIHNSRQKLRAIFDGIEDCIYVVNRDYKITSVNKPLSEKLKITPRKIVDTWCYETLWGRSKPCEDCPLKEHSGGRAIRHFASQNGTTRTTELYVFPVRVEGGFSNEYIMYEKDITILLSLQDRLPSINKLSTMGLMLGDVIHQLNNSINSVKGFCDLSVRPDNKMPQDKIHEHISAEIEKCSGIIRVFTRFAHDRSGELTVINLIDVINESLKTVQFKFSLIRIAVKINLSKEQIPVRGNATKILNAITNIIINSVQAMPDGGSLFFYDKIADLSEVPQDPAIKLENQKYLMLQIKDTGPGLSADALSHIFEPFFTTKNMDQGTGLGLNVVKRIMNEHKGTISCDTAYKDGACFNLYFPV